MALPPSVEEIAEVIGQEAALFLIGQLPTCRAGNSGKQSSRVILYVPKQAGPDHRLVRILGERDAAKLVSAFGGEIMQVANCREVYVRWRDKEARRMVAAGVGLSEVAAIMRVSERFVRHLTREIPQEESRAA